MASPAPLPPIDPQWAAESNLPRILAVTGVFHFLALITVGLRIYVRVRLLRAPGSDDVVIVGAALGALGGWITFILQGYHGLGRHTRTISRPDLIEFEHIGFAQSVISPIAALGLLKISIALFLLRLSKNKWYSRSLWALIVFVTIYSIGAWLTFFLRCRPMEGYWNKDPKAVCYSFDMMVKLGLTNTSLNIFTDVCLGLLPVPIIWNLQMSRRTRINLIGVLSLGYLAIVFGIVKAIYQMAFAADPDRHFTVNLQFWGYLQLNVGIIAASIPSLKPLLKSRDGSSNKYTPYGDLGPSDKGRISRRKSTLRSSDTAIGSYEMSNRVVAGPGKNEYGLGLDRTGSEERILDNAGGADSKGITRTTEVSINNVEKGIRV